MSKYVDVDKVLEKYSEDGNWDLHKVLKGEPPADVVPKEKFLKLLENANILADAVREYQRIFEDEIIKHLEATAKELLDRADEKQSRAFAKGITFAVSMIKNHMKEVEK